MIDFAAEANAMGVDETALKYMATAVASMMQQDGITSGDVGEDVSAAYLEAAIKKQRSMTVTALTRMHEFAPTVHAIVRQ